MGILYVALVVLYTFVCFFLILVVLVQQGRGADIAGAFGGGGTQTAFGARGATTLLHKLTTGGFVAFIVVALVLTILEARPRSSVVPEKATAAKAAPAPAAPVPAAPAQSNPAKQ
ncbi:MAG TPA: preprotein translocase subunit SecG [Thermoanaerobaculia bacterium]|nr:preprotein translocase subunit SecG [Thermoanaerobaculia bacterium]